jgi:hypothetical protein
MRLHNQHLSSTREWWLLSTTKSSMKVTQEAAKRPLLFRYL